MDLCQQRSGLGRIQTRISEVCAVDLKQKTTVSTFPEEFLEPVQGTHTRGMKTRWLGILLVVAGLLFIALAAGDALAGTVVGRGGEDEIRGSAARERMAGLNGDDRLYGLAGDDILIGGRGDDELYGGSGGDALLGGSGDDFIEARDGEQDYVACGSGADVASVDAADVVARSCETVYPD